MTHEALWGEKKREILELMVQDLKGEKMGR